MQTTDANLACEVFLLYFYSRPLTDLCCSTRIISFSLFFRFGRLSVPLCIPLGQVASTVMSGDYFTKRKLTLFSLGVGEEESWWWARCCCAGPARYGHCGAALTLTAHRTDPNGRQLLLWYLLCYSALICIISPTWKFSFPFHDKTFNVLRRKIFLFGCTY